ncbi:MAG: HD domain-containing protein [Patescibacteria group bacterium]
MTNRDIEFLYEIGTLRFIPRTWRQFLNIDFANLAEHTLRVIWTAVIIAKNEEGADLNKVIKMALVHDITESRTGDVHYLSRQYTERNEKSAINDILVDTGAEDEFRALWEEYEDRKSLEAKIVKDADNIDVDLELMEQKARGESLPEKWRPMREQAVATRLYTESAKKIFQLLHEIHPHDWHINAPGNRFKSGDWKK